jgi:hypothetical protein
MDEQKFDASRPMKLILSPDRARTVLVRYPTDEEWTALQREHRVITKPHGRGKSRPKVNRQVSEPVMVALANALRIDGEGAIEISAAEAKAIIEVLAKCDVIGIQAVHGGFRIETVVMGGQHTAHILCRPELAEILQYQANYRSVVRLPHGQQETTLHLKAFGILYDALVLATEGYSGAIPIFHQHHVITALLEEIARTKNSPKSQESARAENAPSRPEEVNHG